MSSQNEKTMKKSIFLLLSLLSLTSTTNAVQCENIPGRVFDYALITPSPNSSFKCYYKDDKEPLTVGKCGETRELEWSIRSGTWYPFQERYQKCSGAPNGCVAECILFDSKMGPLD